MWNLFCSCPMRSRLMRLVGTSRPRTIYFSVRPSHSVNKYIIQTSSLKHKIIAQAEYNQCSNLKEEKCHFIYVFDNYESNVTPNLQTAYTSSFTYVRNKLWRWCQCMSYFFCYSAFNFSPRFHK